MNSKKSTKTITEAKAREIVRRIQAECVSDLKIVVLLKTAEGKYWGVRCKLADDSTVDIKTLTDLKPYNLMRCGRNSFHKKMNEQFVRMFDEPKQ